MSQGARESVEEGEPPASRQMGGIRLCAAKVPRDAAVANTCKVPLGATVTPFLRQLRVQKYLKASGGAGTTTPAAGAGNVTCDRGPAGFVLDSALRCTNAKCKANANPFCEIRQVDKGPWTWRCAMCGTTNAVKPEDEEQLMHQTKKGNEAFEIAFDADEANGDPSNAKRSLVLLVDVTLDEDHMDRVCRGLVDFLRKVLDPAMAESRPSRVALATFGSSATFFHLGDDFSGSSLDVASGDAFPVSLQADDHNAGLANATLRSNHERYFAHNNNNNNNSETLLAKVEKALLSCTSYAADAAIPCPARPRCLVGALGLVSKLIRASEWSLPGHHGHHVMVVTGGHCTIGPGSLPEDDTPDYLPLEREALAAIDRLAERVMSQNLVLDIFGGGHVGLDVPALYPLTQNTGGCVLMYETFGRDYFSAMVGAYARINGARGVLDLRLSSDYLVVDQIMGPIKPISAANRGVFYRGSGESGDLLTENAVELTTVEESHGITFSFSLKTDIPKDSVFLQAEVWYYDTRGGGGWRHRVVTERVRVTSSGREFVLSIDSRAIGVLIAKKTLVAMRKAKYSPPMVATLKKGVATEIYEMSRNFSPKVARGAGLGQLWTKPVCVLQDDLATLAEFVYHFGRCTALRADAHLDEKMCFVALFLRLGTAAAAAMVWPRCLLVDLEGNAGHSLNHRPVTALPAADALVELVPHFVMDCGTDCFVFVRASRGGTGGDNGNGNGNGGGGGGEGEGARRVFEGYYDYMRRQEVGGRFPVPRVHLCCEGRPSARHVHARLIPTRQDTPEDQGHQVRALGAMERGRHAATLLSSLHRTDEPSFKEWCALWSLSCGKRELGTY